MSTFIVLGKFSGQGAKGLMTSDADRSAIVDKAARAAGAKMISYHITRGIYDFCVIAEGEDEETVIAMKGTVMMSGDFCLLYTSPSPRDLSTSRMPSSA